MHIIYQHRRIALLGNEDFVQGDVFDPAACIRAYRNYYAAVTDIDRNVGRILDRLQALGQLENTLVIYTSDHGLALGHNGFWGKGNSTRPLNMYEVSLRIPLILRWPGNLARGHTVAHCVDHYDTFQTICDMAAISPPAGGWPGRMHTGYAYPGYSYTSLAQGTALPEWNETRYGEYGDLRMIRTPHDKLVKRYPNGPDDLFDLLHDPEERINLAGRPDMAEIQTALRTDLESYYTRYTDFTSSGLRVKKLRRHNVRSEAWRDGKRESRGLQIY
ncbi:MAG: sulfatase-like hydrolase/transferase [Chloroflexi bacterium]|nr:sulfatase-like hydrolase/transferase [Chloroflexota bacterium]